LGIKNAYLNSVLNLRFYLQESLPKAKYKPRGEEKWRKEKQSQRKK
jgi:hypothetical protein